MTPRRKAARGYEVVVLPPKTSHEYVQNRTVARQLAQWIRDALALTGNSWDRNRRVRVRELPAPARKARR